MVDLKVNSFDWILFFGESSSKENYSLWGLGIPHYSEAVTGRLLSHFSLFWLQ